MLIRIKNLRIRTIVGINEWERNASQDIIVNIEMELDGSRVSQTDAIEDTVDYKTLKQRIMMEIETSRFFLLDKLANHVLGIVMSDAKVQRATVEVDKPHALRFADSVSVVWSGERE